MKIISVELEGDQVFYAAELGGQTVKITAQSVQYPKARENLRKLFERSGITFDQLYHQERAAVLQEFKARVAVRPPRIEEYAVQPNYYILDLTGAEPEAQEVTKVRIDERVLSEYIPKVLSLATLIYFDKDHEIEINPNEVISSFLQTLAGLEYIREDNDLWTVVLHRKTISPDEAVLLIEEGKVLLRLPEVFSYIPSPAILEALIKYDYEVRVYLKQFVKWYDTHKYDLDNLRTNLLKHLTFVNDYGVDIDALSKQLLLIDIADPEEDTNDFIEFISKYQQIV